MRPFVLILLAAAATSGFAEPNRKLPGVKLAAPPKIDGVVSMEEWGGAAKSSGFVHVATGEKMPFDAEIFAGYDAENLYFAYRCPDADPKSIGATEYRRNADVDGDDHVILLINPFANHQESDANQFKVGAGGGMTAEFAGGRASKREWEGAWDAKARITEQGWECEIVIPWKILRLPSAGVRDIEINFARYVPRHQAPVAWCELGAQERFENNGSWTGVEVPSIRKGGEILLLPYQIAGYDQERKQEIINTGLDLRYEITPQIASLMTVNPDFRNVEGAVLNLAFSRFERLAEERRPFFVEGSGEFRIGGRSASLFAPQRIRGFDFGAKAFGKLSNNQSFGALVTTHFDHETAAVARYRQTWGIRSYLNAGLVHWDDEQGGIRNTASSVEMNQWSGHFGAGLIYNRTDDSVEGDGKRFDADFMFQDSNTFAAIGYQEISADFLPRIGFAPRKGFQGWNGSLFHQREFGSGPISSYSLEVSGVDTENDPGDGVYLRSLDVSGSFSTRDSLDVGVFASRSNFRGNKADLYGFDLEYPDNNPYRNFGIEFVSGTVDDERYVNYGISGNYRFENRISLTPAFQYEKLGSESETLGILGVSYEIDRNRSIAGRAVFREDKANWYLAYRLSGNIGTEWYVILGDPNAEEFQRKLIVKAVVPLAIRF